MSDTLKLRAISPGDIEVFSSLLQDSILRVGDLTWQDHDHRFAAIFNRYRWEKKRGIWPFRRTPERVQSALHFNGVMSVESSGFDVQDTEAFLSLLTIKYENSESAGDYLQLDFSAGATIRLHCECIDGVLSDLGESWQALKEPQHN